MTIFQVKCFLMVAETLNFTEAANKLFIAQSSLSRNISHLEDELGLSLFIRTKKYVRLTPSGTVLYAEFSKLLLIGEHALEKARNADLGEQGSIRLGVLETQRSENILPARINLLRQKHPKIKIDIISGSFRELREAIYSGEIDIAFTLSISLEDYDQKDIVSQVVYHSQPQCAISSTHPLAVANKFTLDALNTETMIAINPEESFGAYNNIRQFCERHDIVPSNVIFANSTQDILLKVEAGLGFSVLDANCISSTNSSILSIPFYKTEPLDLIAIWKKENMNPVIPLFTNLLISTEE